MESEDIRLLEWAARSFHIPQLYWLKKDRGKDVYNDWFLRKLNYLRIFYEYSKFQYQISEVLQIKEISEYLNV